MFRRRHLGLCLISCLLSIQPIKGQKSDPNYANVVLDVSSGLSNNYVSKIIEDDIGFKWIATEGGLNRYDGFSFKIFKPSTTSTLKNENIEVVFKDSRGDLWIGTKSGGLALYDVRKEKIINYNTLIFGSEVNTKTRITSITEDLSGRIFIGTWREGLLVFDPSAQSVGHYLDQSYINALETDHYGNIWIGTHHHLLKYDPSEERIIKISDFDRVTAIHHDKGRNKLWISVRSKGLYYLDLENYSVRPTKLTWDGLDIASINVDVNGRFWAGTWNGGLYYSDDPLGEFQKYSLVPSDFKLKNTSYESILDIHPDDDGIIWICTAFGGVVKLVPTNEFLFLGNSPTVQSGLSDHNTYAICIDSRDRIWTGTFGAGMNLSTDGVHFQPLPKVPASKVNVIYEMNDQILVGTREGLYKINIDNPHEVTAIYPKLEKVTSLEQSHNGDLWIGTQQSGLFIAGGSSHATRSSLKSAPDSASYLNWIESERISKLIKDEDGNMWIGTYNGLYVYNPRDKTFVNVSSILKELLPSVIVHDMDIDKANECLWLAMPGGLVKLSLNIFITRSVKDVEVFQLDQGLKNDFVTSVHKGADGNVWIGTAYGISKYIIKKKVFVNYGLSDGIGALSFNIKAVDASGRGRLYFGSSHGLLSFDPVKVKEVNNAPGVLMTGITINNRTVKVGEGREDHPFLSQSFHYTDEITLSHEEKVFSILMAPKDYKGEENITYQYRLLGFQDEWVRSNDTREVRFTNLYPGSYTLEIRASRDGQRWGSIASKKIRIKPPLWATWYAFLLYFIIFTSLIYLYTYISRKQSKLRTHLEIEKIAREKDQELSEAKIRFFTNISHEFRTPLTLILAPLEELIVMNDLSSKAREKLVVMEKNTSKLLNLINQLLDFRKSENNLLRLQVAHGDFVQFAKEVFLSFQSLSKSKHIKYQFKADPKSIYLPYDRNKMEIVLVNLLSNAFKYTPANGSISLKILEDINNCEITISDSGIGINPEQLAHIFDRYYQIRTTESVKMTGSGIGLSLAKNIVELHHGEIEANSGPGQGTDMTVRLPIQNKKLEKDDFIVDFRNSDHSDNYRLPGNDPLSLPGQTGPDHIDEDKEKILVVDDNTDIRDYLESIFSDTYHLLSAANGTEALQLTKNEHPDLIISDIMMPEMDGITLCSKLKSDINTSYIPVILLTARTSTVYEVNSFQTGADDYIRKPFNPSVVKMRVESLLENRRKIRGYFINKLRFEPSKDVQPTDADESFVQRAISLIEGHIDDSSFGLENLTDELAMSQSTLYRRIKSLTGLSISGFIRSVRLKKAADLIITSNWKLSQVAYEVGFNDYKYFKSSFQKQFGCLPSEYKEQNLKHHDTEKTG